MDFQNSLSNQFLIAMPGMADPNFNSTVTLICEHNAAGALGIVINRPTNMELGGLFAHLALEQVDQAAGAPPVLEGGPVGREHGFVLHRPCGEYESSIAVSPDLQLTLSRDVLQAIAAGTGPEQSLVALGYAGWEAGQLEYEMLQNTWLNVPANPEIIFNVPYGDRLRMAAKIIGVDLSQISTHVGHA